ncbi:MAG: phage terminase large subunit [Rickettsiales bacterium]
MDSQMNILLSKSCFKAFLFNSFTTLCPGTEMLDNWHIDLIINNLEKINHNKTRRLIINLPPRSMKSIIISVVWPAWILAHDPRKKIIVASYSQKLSEKFSLDTKLIINSQWYQKAYPQTKIARGANCKWKFVTTQQGFRFATSVGGTLTGEGADIIIVDDPHTPLQALSTSERERTLNWYDQTLASRLNDKKRGIIVVVMQRLHQDDLSGHLLSKKTWLQLKIAAVAESDEQWHDFIYQRKIGELLHPNREGEDEVENAKIELGSYAFNAQYQQAPISSNNSLFRREWLLRYNRLPTFNSIYQSWDCAVKNGELNDFSVCTTWGISENQYYLVEVLRKKINYPDLKQMVIDLAEKHEVTAILIEDKVSGQVLIQELATKLAAPIISIMPKGDKFTRFIHTLALFEARRVSLPINASWLSAFESELFAFPQTKHDDQVDSTTQFLNWALRKSQVSAARLRQV